MDSAGISKVYQSVEIHLDVHEKRQTGSGEGNRFTHKKINQELGTHKLT